MCETAISKPKVISITGVVQFESRLEVNLHQNSKTIEKYI
jgi:hypothetical protein